MHESGVIADLMQEAARRSGDKPDAISMLRVRIGAMSPYSPAAIDHGLRQSATQLWDTEPQVIVELGQDPTDAAALGIELLSISVER